MLDLSGKEKKHLCLGLTIPRPGMKEMAQQLRPLAALQRTRKCNSTWRLTTTRDSSFRGCDTSFSDLHRQAGGTHTNRHTGKRRIHTK